MHRAGLEPSQPVRPHSRPILPLGTLNVDDAPGARLHPPFENVEAGKMPGKTVWLQLLRTVNVVASARGSPQTATATITGSQTREIDLLCMCPPGATGS